MLAKGLPASWSRSSDAFPSTAVGVTGAALTAGATTPMQKVTASVFGTVSGRNTSAATVTK